MFPDKAHGPTVFDFNFVGLDAACCQQAKEGPPLFMGMPLVMPPMNAIPEQTLLYQLVEKHYPALVEKSEVQGKKLPTHVHREFEALLKCGRVENGFLRVRCERCHFERFDSREVPLPHKRDEIRPRSFGPAQISVTPHPDSRGHGKD